MYVFWSWCGLLKRESEGYVIFKDCVIVSWCRGIVRSSLMAKLNLWSDPKLIFFSHKKKQKTILLSFYHSVAVRIHAIFESPDKWHLGAFPEEGPFITTEKPQPCHCKWTDTHRSSHIWCFTLTSYFHPCLCSLKRTILLLQPQGGKVFFIHLVHNYWLMLGVSEPVPVSSSDHVYVVWLPIATGVWQRHLGKRSCPRK